MNPYDNKPDLVSDPDTWHTITFNISVDVPVDWSKLDLRQWSHTVGKYTALRMAETTQDVMDEHQAQGLIKTLLMGIKVERVKLVDDDELHTMIDEFNEE